MNVTVTKNAFVAVVEIDKPPHNHVSVELMTELADALEALDADPDCRAILLCSAGKNFCAGADLARPIPGAAQSETGNPLYVQAVRLFSTKKPIVAAVQGSAVGAGLGLAVVADFRVATPDARFTANFVKLGFHPGFGLTYTLPRLIGGQRASLLFQTGRRIKADEALAWGLVDEIAEDARAAAMRIAVEIAENAPLAVQSTRLTLRGDIGAAVKAQTDHEHAEQAWLRKTDDFAEGVRAVSERRPGAFTGR
ncbi:enoyl-CoA hydratase/isomerase family protein [soil metagenome]